MDSENISKISKKNRTSFLHGAVELKFKPTAEILCSRLLCLQELWLRQNYSIWKQRQNQNSPLICGCDNCVGKVCSIRHNRRPQVCLCQFISSLANTLRIYRARRSPLNSKNSRLKTAFILYSQRWCIETTGAETRVKNDALMSTNSTQGWVFGEHEVVVNSQSCGWGSTASWRSAVS